MPRAPDQRADRHPLEVEHTQLIDPRRDCRRGSLFVRGGMDCGALIGIAWLSPTVDRPQTLCVVVHVVIRALLVAQNTQRATAIGSNRAENGSNWARWTKLSRFRDREAPGANPGFPVERDSGRPPRDRS